MTDRLPPNLQKLFLPNPPLQFLPPNDFEPAARRTAIPGPVTDFLEALREPDPDYVPTESRLQLMQRIKEEKIENHKRELDRQRQEYNPEKDPKITSDAYKTLFVSRLSYEADEEDLHKAFGKFGDIKNIRIVQNTQTDKPAKKKRGYAFIEFDREKDFKEAYKQGEGFVIRGRRVVVDCERGRTVKDWKPRRLGGGLGGRHYTKQHVRGSMGGSHSFGAPAGPRGGFRGGFGGRGGGGFGGRGGRPPMNGGGFGGGRSYAPEGAPAGPRGPRSGGYGSSNGYSGGGGGGGGRSYDERGVSGSNMEPVRPRERGGFRDRDRDGGYDRDYQSSRKRDYDGGDYDSSRKRRY